jgi:hypothetical protein
LEKLREQGWLDICYYDESGFSLTACLLYAWQKKGETIAIVPGKGKRMNVAGFYAKTRGLQSHLQQQGFSQQHLIEIFNCFCQGISQKTIVVLDNAPSHHGKAFQAKVKQWQEQDLYWFYLPPYSPELNCIEILWKRIKYDWLKFDAYLNFKSLRLNLETVLLKIENEYTINFD